MFRTYISALAYCISLIILSMSLVVHIGYTLYILSFADITLNSVYTGPITLYSAMYTSFEIFVLIQSAVNYALFKLKAFSLYQSTKLNKLSLLNLVFFIGVLAITGTYIQQMLY